MPGRVLRHPFAVGFALTLLVSVLLLPLLAPTTGWAQGPVGSNDQGWVPIQGGNEPRNLTPMVPSLPRPSVRMETPGGQVLPPDTDNRSQDAKGRQGTSTQSVGENLTSALSPSGPSAYSSPLVIPAADFRNNGLSTDRYFVKLGEDGYGGYFTATSGAVCMMAPAQLPGGAHVFDMWATIFDNGGATRPWLKMYRVDNFDASLPVHEMGGILSSSTSVNVQNVVGSGIDSSTIIFPEFSYYVGGCVYDFQQHIYSMRLYYDW